MDCLTQEHKDDDAVGDDGAGRPIPLLVAAAAAAAAIGYSRDDESIMVGVLGGQFVERWRFDSCRFVNRLYDVQS
jgi:hypothetical protein